MIKRILNYYIKEDKEILQQKSLKVKEINEDIKQLIQDLDETLKNTQIGKGISAVQIGELLRICICMWDGKKYIMINPYITDTRGQQEYKEGCLSVPNIIKKVSRAQRIICTFTDENGNEKTINVSGRMADIIQHELDHLDGISKLYD